MVPKFGYDRPGRVVKIDSRKQIAIVAIGQMQWDVKIEELIPQSIRVPEVADNSSTKRKPKELKPGSRLEDFRDDRR